MSGTEIKKYNRKEGLSNKKRLTSEIRSILKDSWGEFPDSFVVDHVINSERVLVAHHENEPIAVCSLDVLEIKKKQVYYIEFLAVKKKYQRQKIGSFLIRSMVVHILLRDFFDLLFKPLEVMFITPNIRVLCFASQVAHFIYPNPHLTKEDGTVEEADEETWLMTRELLDKSDRPNRFLEREGNVLHGSYDSMSWLIYDEENIPWHQEEHINNFAKKYLGYGKREDKEFIVRMQLSLRSLLNYVLKKWRRAF